MKTLIILNPHAASGRALKHFKSVKPLLSEFFEVMRVAVSSHECELEPHLRRAFDDGFDTVLALGGDGTNFAVVNALAEAGGLKKGVTFATLPFGTGRDWARTLGMPEKACAMLGWLAEGMPQLVDVGCVTIDGQRSLFLNVASAGISGAMAPRVNATRVKRPWTFLQATVSTLFSFEAPQIRVFLDGNAWYEGGALLLAVGNGRFFGRGMKVCPNAFINDGLFEVVLIEDMSTLQALRALPTLLKGTHIQRHDVHVRRARKVRLESIDETLDLEMDGEPNQGQVIEFELLPSVLRMLVDPKVEAIKLAPSVK